MEVVSYIRRHVIATCHYHTLKMVTVVFSETFVNNCRSIAHQTTKIFVGTADVTSGTLKFRKRQGISWLRHDLVARFWFLKALLLKIQVFWDITSSGLVNTRSSRRFERSHCLYAHCQAVPERSS